MYIKVGNVHIVGIKALVNISIHRNYVIGSRGNRSAR